MLRRFFPLLALLFVAVSPAVRADEPTIDIVFHNKGFNSLVQAVSAAGLIPEMQTGGPFTILGPTDVAFRNLAKADLDALMADKQKLATVLRGHIVEGRIASAKLTSATLKTLAGTTLEFKVVDGKIKVQGATVVKPDVSASNGVIHGIDKLLLP